jgi:type II secretory pathway predicted ATPase ExeA
VFLNFSSLKENPFRITPDPRYLYLTDQHAKAKTYIESSGFLMDGFVVITGEIGSGKTILISDFLSKLPSDVNVVTIHQTQISPVQFLQMFLAELGFEPFNMKKAELLNMVNTCLIDTFAEGKRTVLICDEAQHLSLRVLEEIRLLAGIETGNMHLLSIILAGQPAFKDKLYSPCMEQLAQRTPLHFHLGPLDRAETGQYIEHRLGVAGDTTNRVFLPNTFDLIYEYAGGVPRLINTLCNASMMCAFAEDRTVVSQKSVNLAVEELQWHVNDTAKAEGTKPAQRRPDPDMKMNGNKPEHRNEKPERERVSREQDKIIARLQTDLNKKIAKVGTLEDDIRRLREVQSKTEKHYPENIELEEDNLVLAETINALRTEFDAATKNGLRLGRQFKEANALNELLASELESKEKRIESYEHDIEALRNAKLLAESQRTIISPNAARQIADREPNEIRMLVAIDDNESRELEIGTGQLSLGSSPDNDIQIKSEFVSPHHAQIISSPTGSVLRDLNSSNGTYVNAKRIKRHGLRDGDVITIGKDRIKYVRRLPGNPGPSGEDQWSKDQTVGNDSC